MRNNNENKAPDPPSREVESADDSSLEDELMTSSREQQQQQQQQQPRTPPLSSAATTPDETESSSTQQLQLRLLPSSGMVTTKGAGLQIQTRTEQQQDNNLRDRIITSTTTATTQDNHEPNDASDRNDAGRKNNNRDPPQTTPNQNDTETTVMEQLQAQVALQANMLTHLQKELESSRAREAALTVERDDLKQAACQKQQPSTTSSNSAVLLPFDDDPMSLPAPDPPTHESSSSSRASTNHHGGIGKSSGSDTSAGKDVASSFSSSKDDTAPSADVFLAPDCNIKGKDDPTQEIAKLRAEMAALRASLTELVQERDHALQEVHKLNEQLIASTPGQRPADQVQAKADTMQDDGASWGGGGIDEIAQLRAEMAVLRASQADLAEAVQDRDRARAQVEELREQMNRERESALAQVDDLHEQIDQILTQKPGNAHDDSPGGSHDVQVHKDLTADNRRLQQDLLPAPTSGFDPLEYKLQGMLRGNINDPPTVLMSDFDNAAAAITTYAAEELSYLTQADASGEQEQQEAEAQKQEAGRRRRGWKLLGRMRRGRRNRSNQTHGESPPDTATTESRTDAAQERIPFMAPDEILATSEGLGFYSSTRTRVDPTLIPYSRNGRNRYKVDDVYQIGEMVGKGAFGEIFKATNTMDSRDYAVKRVKPIENLLKVTLDDYNDVTVRCGEVQALLALRNAPGVLQIKEFFYDFDGSNVEMPLAIVTELLHGQDLDLWMKNRVERSPKNPVPEHAGRQIIGALLQTVAYMHSHNVVHRDLKVSNIRLTNPSDPRSLKLYDFGLARVLNGPSDRLTDDCGSLGYTAPEVLRRTPYGIEVDMFSAGVILFYLLSGYRPFNGADRSETNKRCRELEYKMDSSRWAVVSETAKNLVQQLLVEQDDRLTAVEAIGHDWFYSDDLSSFVVKDDSSSVSFSSSIAIAGADSESAAIQETANPHPSAWAAADEGTAWNLSALHVPNIVAPVTDSSSFQETVGTAKPPRASSTIALREGSMLNLSSVDAPKVATYPTVGANRPAVAQTEQQSKDEPTLFVPNWLTGDHENILKRVIEEKYESVQEEEERRVILASSSERDFYALLIRKLFCMIRSCETLSTGMVASGNGETVRAMTVRILQHGGCKALRETEIGTLVSKAIGWVAKQTSAIPFSNAVGSFFQLVCTIKHERDQYLAISRVADFATLTGLLSQDGSDGLSKSLERFARLLVRARQHYMEDRRALSSKQFLTKTKDQFGKTKQLVLKVLAEAADTPAKQQGCLAADAALAHIMHPSSGSALRDILRGKDDTGVHLHEALAAATLELSVNELRKIARRTDDRATFMAVPPENDGTTTFFASPSVAGFAKTQYRDFEPATKLDLQALEEKVEENEALRAKLNALTIEMRQIKRRMLDETKKNPFEGDGNAGGLLLADFFEEERGGQDAAHETRAEVGDLKQQVAMMAEALAALQERADKQDDHQGEANNDKPRREP